MDMEKCFSVSARTHGFDWFDAGQTHQMWVTWEVSSMAHKGRLNLYTV